MSNPIQANTLITSPRPSLVKTGVKGRDQHIETLAFMKSATALMPVTSLLQNQNFFMSLANKQSQRIHTQQPKSEPLKPLKQPTTNGKAEGYFNDTWESLKVDWHKYQADFHETNRYWKEQSFRSTLYQQVGNGAGFLANAIGSAINNDQTQAWANKALDRLTETHAYQASRHALASMAQTSLQHVDSYLEQHPELKQSLLHAAHNGMQVTQELINKARQFAKEHPEATRNLAATGNLLQLVGVGKAATLGVKASGKALNVSVKALHRVDIQVEPHTLGINGGNLRIRLKVPDNALGPTRPTGIFSGKPEGPRTTLKPNAKEDNKRGLRRENESADRLADAGYRVYQNPKDTGLLTPGMQKKLGLKVDKNPDYLIEGRVFDNYAPTANQARGIWEGIGEKVGKRQAHRIVLNLADTPVSYREIRQYLQANPIPGLKEMIVVEPSGIIRQYLPNRQ